MRKYGRQCGLTLTELLVTVAIAAVLLAIGAPAAKRLTESMQNTAGTQGLIAAALSNARAIAVREGKYAGVRFQRAADGRTYMVFIINDPVVGPHVPGNLGCMAMQGRKPIALPENAGVIDGFIKLNYGDGVYTDDKAIASELDINSPQKWTDTNTFSILFSPAGKVIQHTLRVRSVSPNDSVFNTPENVTAPVNPIGILIQDGYPDRGLDDLEMSRTTFFIYNKKELEAVNPAQRWSAYLSRIKPTMVSPYTGELIGN